MARMCSLRNVWAIPIRYTPDLLSSKDVYTPLCAWAYLKGAKQDSANVLEPPCPRM